MTDCNEVEELSAFFHGWRVELIQLGPRRDRTVVSCASFPSHRILRLHAGSALVLRGTVHKACCCVLLSASPQTAARILGQPLDANELLLAGSGASLDLFVPSGALLYALVLYSSRCISRRAVRTCAGYSMHAVARLTHYIRRPDHRINSDTTLAKQLRRAVATSSSVPLDRFGKTPRVSAVMSACQLVESRIPAPVTLGDLSRHCGVAARTLEYGFKQVYDTTPLAFFRSQRLTRSRMALLRAAAHTSISQTARAFGFTHMGQYSRDYRRLFGETPSMTLARGKMS